MNKKIVSVYIVIVTFLLLFAVQPYWGIWGMLPISLIGSYLYHKTKESV